MTTDYEAFIARKERERHFSGLPYPEPDARLFPFQSDLVGYALRGGRRALFADTGLGKSRMEAEWCGQVATEGRVLVLTPLAVAQQWVREAEQIDVESVYLREDDGTSPIVVTNYDMMQHFDPSKFTGVCLDECFAPGTWIDLEGGRKRIEDVTVGDKIVNASGIDAVSDVHRREVPFAIRLFFNGHSVICSPNHPWFTQRGWVGAQDLHPGDSLMESGAAMRMVRGDLHPEAQAVRGRAILRAILFSEMADASAGNPGTGSLTGSGGEEGGGEAAVAGVGSPEGAGGTHTHRSDEPDGRPLGVRQDLPHVESHEARTFRTWGERAWLERAAGDDARCSWTDLGSGVCRVVGPTDSRLSDVLQARLGAARVETRDRGGWVHAPITEGPREGREEGRRPGFVGVDRLEVLEPGHPDLEQFRSADGKLYFYDLGGTRHPSFSVEGVLVHNSSILKSYTGATRNLIIEGFADTPYRLAGTATPAPNDFTELGNHSEFLGIQSRVEMLSEYFCHDGGSTQDWRLKGHAEAAFWRWVCSWGAIVRSPSDLGYDDGAYALPPLQWHEHVVDVDHSAFHAEGYLFAPAAETLSDQRATRRATMDERVRMAADIAAQVQREGRPILVWCELNAEADAVTDAIKGAVQVSGSDDPDTKTERLLGFADGKYPAMVSKPSVAGFGLNWQVCSDMIFVGASHSYEQTYQAVRRCWRFGQTRPVNVHVIRAQTESAIVANYQRKEADAKRLADATSAFVKDIVMADVRGGRRAWNLYNPSLNMKVPAWIR